MEAISHYGIESVSWIRHQTANTGSVLIYWKKGESKAFSEEEIGSVSGGVENGFKRSIDMAKDRKDLIKKYTEVKEKAVRRAKILDEELGQK